MNELKTIFLENLGKPVFLYISGDYLAGVIVSAHDTMLAVMRDDRLNYVCYAQISTFRFPKTKE